MGLLETARDALKEIPLSDVLKERLSLALDQSAESERRVSELQLQKAKIEATFEIERLDHQKTKEQLSKLKELAAEEIRIWRTVEFRRGARTQGAWLPFCPKCHLPLNISNTGPDKPTCDDKNCGWSSSVLKQNVWAYAGR